MKENFFEVFEINSQNFEFMAKIVAELLRNNDEEYKQNFIRVLQNWIVNFSLYSVQKLLYRKFLKQIKRQ